MGLLRGKENAGHFPKFTGFSIVYLGAEYQT
jgi:hypothetical protein